MGVGVQPVSFRWDRKKNGLRECSFKVKNNPTTNEDCINEIDYFFLVTFGADTKAACILWRNKVDNLICFGYIKIFPWESSRIKKVKKLLDREMVFGLKSFFTIAADF